MKGIYVLIFILIGLLILLIKCLFKAYKSYRSAEADDDNATIVAVISFFAGVVLNVIILIVTILLAIPGTADKLGAFLGVDADAPISVETTPHKVENNTNNIATNTAPNTNSSNTQVHTHSWKAATCTAPQMCATCGETKGSALGHTWQDAYYETPKTCTNCGATEGKALLHDSSRSFDGKMKVVASYYTEVMDARHNGMYEKVRLRPGVYIYYNSDGEAVYMDITESVDGLGGYGNNYNRMYYISKGKLVFALFEGEDEHRLYFYEEELIRWRYDAYDGTRLYFDLEDTAEYHMWEQLALAEVQDFAAFLKN